MLGFVNRRLGLSFVCVLLLVAVILCSFFVSCGKNDAPYGLMLEFCEIYGIEDTVFSPTLAEGDLGYANDEFFELVFGEKPYSVSDYAVVFLSDLDFVGECALLLCYSEGDALDACLLLRERIDLLKSMGTGMDTSYLADAVVFKSGRYAVLCALSDNVKAEKTWRKLL